MKRLLSYLFVIMLAFGCIFQVLVTANAESEMNWNEPIETIDYKEEKTIILDDDTKNTKNLRSINSDMNKIQKSEVVQYEDSFSNEGEWLLSTINVLKIEENLSSVDTVDESDIIGNIILSEFAVCGAGLMYILRKSFIGKK